MPNDPLTPDPDGDAPVDFDPAAFSGVARLFPLPAVSLYPRVVQPLHIHEERYRELMDDALDGDGLIAMAVLKPGWEPDYASRPDLEPHACLGLIVGHHRLDDGRYNLLLAGVARVRILGEIDPPRSFRRANVELLAEIEPGAPSEPIRRLQERLAEAFRAALPHGDPPEPLRQVFEPDTPIGLLADLASYTLPLKRGVKQAVLAEPDAVVRARVVLAALEDSAGQNKGAEPDDGPPSFSLN